MMKKNLLIIGVAILSLMPVMPVAATSAEDGGVGETTTGSTSTSVPSGSCEGDSFLFMRPWYAGLNCTDGKIDEDQFSSEKIGDTIASIVAVVTEDILRIIGVLAAGFLIYGGFQYAYSGGDMGKAAKGKRTIQAAIIGMIIALIGQIAVNTFRTIVKQAGGAQEDVEVAGVVAGSLNLFKIRPEELLGTTVNFVLGAATLVSVGFIIYAGVNMATAYGSPDKTAKARKTIMYAVVGLLVSMLAFAIVNFVLGGLSMAMPEGDKTDIFSLVNTIFGWVIGIMGLLATVGIIVGGVQYTISTGDAQKTQKAKQTILYSIIGLIVALLAGAIVSFVIKAAFGS